jgi:hypothetical protein
MLKVYITKGSGSIGRSVAIYEHYVNLLLACETASHSASAFSDRFRKEKQNIKVFILK